MQVIRCSIAFLTLMILHFCAGAQFYNLPSEFAFSLLTERKLAAKDSSIHTGVKPYVPFFSPRYRHVGDTHHVFRYLKDDPGIDVVFNDHLIAVAPRGEKFTLRLDPLLNLETGRDAADRTGERLYSNTRGFIGSGAVGERFYFETMFSENQSFFPGWIAAHAKSTSVVPGQGRWKTFKSTGYDYAFSSGFFSVQVFPNVNLQAGHGKHKIGHGYRSLLLSDNAFNYPYARLTQQWFEGRLQYHNIYAVLMNLVPASAVTNPLTERLFQKKPAAFQYLSYNPSGAVNLGFFQGVMWESGNSRNRQQTGVDYFVPLIFYHSAKYGFNHTNNVLAGADLKVKMNGKINLYGQWMTDDLSGHGYQAGANFFDLFGVKHLYFQAEYNDVPQRAYTDPSAAATDQSYTHYNQNLAFTPGSGRELVLAADYRYRRLFIHVRYHYQESGPGTRPTVFTDIVNARAGYLINPSYNLNLSAGVTYRNRNFSNFSSSNNEAGYIFVALSTSIYNLYYDF